MPFIVLLTHVDELQNTKNIKEALNQCSKLLDVELSKVFPWINYNFEAMNNPKLDEHAKAILGIITSQ